jgi:hypothetical protein
MRLWLILLSVTTLLDVGTSEKDGKDLAGKQECPCDAPACPPDGMTKASVRDIQVESGL